MPHGLEGCVNIYTQNNSPLSPSSGTPLTTCRLLCNKGAARACTPAGGSVSSSAWSLFGIGLHGGEGRCPSEGRGKRIVPCRSNVKATPLFFFTTIYYSISYRNPRSKQRQTTALAEHGKLRHHG